jgi:hypothetical protein
MLDKPATDTADKSATETADKKYGSEILKQLTRKRCFECAAYIVLPTTITFIIQCS